MLRPTPPEPSSAGSPPPLVSGRCVYAAVVEHSVYVRSAPAAADVDHVSAAVRRHPGQVGPVAVPELRDAHCRILGVWSCFGQPRTRHRHRAQWSRHGSAGGGSRCRGSALDVTTVPAPLPGGSISGSACGVGRIMSWLHGADGTWPAIARIIAPAHAWSRSSSSRRSGGRRLRGYAGEWLSGAVTFRGCR
jgi:hypothetical protein